jgi:hypothetical protein
VSRSGDTFPSEPARWKRAEPFEPFEPGAASAAPFPCRQTDCSSGGPHAQEDKGGACEFSYAHVFTEEEVGEDGGEDRFQGENEACPFGGGIFLGHGLHSEAVGGGEDCKPQNSTPFGKGGREPWRFQKEGGSAGHEACKAHLPYAQKQAVYFGDEGIGEENVQGVKEGRQQAEHETLVQGDGSDAVQDEKTGGDDGGACHDGEGGHLPYVETVKDGDHDDGGGNKESGGGGGGADDTVNDADEDAGNEKAGDGAVFQYFPVRLPDTLHEEGEQEEEGKKTAQRRNGDRRHGLCAQFHKSVGTAPHEGGSKKKKIGFLLAHSDSL